MVRSSAESVLSTIEGNVAQLTVAMHPSKRRPTWLASLIQLLDPVSSGHAGPALDGIRVSVEGFDPITITAAQWLVLRAEGLGVVIARETPLQ